jgi:methionyl-tRNA formyltransferase
MNIIFYGGRQSGMVSLLTVLALGHRIVSVIPVDNSVKLVAESLLLNIKEPKNVNDNDFVEYLKTLNADLFICCHGRQIIKSQILNEFKSINLHPCLYNYKGSNPISRLLKDGNKKASVAAHWMTEKVDEGEVVVENFREIKSDTIVGVYNEIYDIYAKTIIDALNNMVQD